MARDKKGESRAVLCSSCRLLISNQETRCPHCGAVQPNLFGFGGALRKLFRDRIDVVQLVFGACVTFYALSIVADVNTALNPRGILDVGSPSGLALYLFGMTGGEAWRCGHVWTLLTANLLHGSLLHIVFNLMWLRTLGAHTVSYMGPARVVVIFFGAGAGGFLVSNLLSNAPTIGASAGIFGLLGALLVFGRRRGGTVGAAIQSQLLYWTVLGFAFTFMMPRVNLWAHVGGLVAGGLIALAMPKHEGRHEGRAVQLLALLLLAATLLGFGLSGWRMWDTFRTGYGACWG